MLAKGTKVRILEPLVYAGGGTQAGGAERRTIPTDCIGKIVSDPCYICDSTGESTESAVVPTDCLDKSTAYPHYKCGDTMTRQYTVRFDDSYGRPYVWAYLRSDEIEAVQV